MGPRAAQGSRVAPPFNNTIPPPHRRPGSALRRSTPPRVRASSVYNTIHPLILTSPFTHPSRLHPNPPAQSTTAVDRRQRAVALRREFVEAVASPTETADPFRFPFDPREAARLSPRIQARRCVGVGGLLLSWLVDDDAMRQAGYIQIDHPSFFDTHKRNCHSPVHWCTRSGTCDPAPRPFCGAASPRPRQGGGRRWRRRRRRRRRQWAFFWNSRAAGERGVCGLGGWVDVSLVSWQEGGGSAAVSSRSRYHHTTTPIASGRSWRSGASGAS